MIAVISSVCHSTQNRTEMSWLFGMGGGGQGPPSVPLPPSDGKDGSDPPKPLTKSEMESYRFDSAALERAAQAARELEKSSKLSF